MNHKDTCFNEVGPRLQILLTTPHTVVNTIGGPMFSSKKFTSDNLY